MTGDEEELLTGVRRPMVLLPRRDGEPGAGLSDAVAPGNPDLGLMLPYTPLHVLLFGIGDDRPGPDALVMTSGNLAGEPIVTDDALARSVLAPLADAWLRHDREIHVAVRRLGQPVRGRRGTAGAQVPRVRAAAAGTALRRAGDARGRRRPEEHLRGGGGPLRLGQPAHRRHGRPVHRRGADPHRAAPRTPHRGHARTTRGRPAPRLPLRRLGPRARRRPSRAHRAAPPRAHRLRDGRARPRRRGQRDRGGLRRHRLRHRRRGLGR